jgi:hypothetical protein
MSVLLCSFASHRSSPEKIQRWIAHLEAKLESHWDDPDAARVIHALLTKARRWT